MPKPGWLNERFKEVEKEVKSWPAWMRKEAGLEDVRETSENSEQSKAKPEKPVAKSAAAGRG